MRVLRPGAPHSRFPRILRDDSALVRARRRHRARGVRRKLNFLQYAVGAGRQEYVHETLVADLRRRDARRARRRPSGLSTGYRGWLHVKSAILTPSHPAAPSEGGIHHIYANAQAAAGYRSGQFPDGAVIVYELLETREKDGVVSEGPRRRLHVMTKQSSGNAATGGWAFSRYMGAAHTGGQIDNAPKACFGCHASQKEHGFVFSRIRSEE